MSPLPTPRRRLLPWLSALSLLALTTGCESEPRNVGGSSKSKSSASASAPSKPAGGGPILGQTTQDIKPSDGTLPSNAQLASSKVVAKDPITIVGNAYVSIVGQSQILNMKHTMDLFYNMNERYPKDFDEFMNEIIKPNGIRLAQLPYYQEYRYNEKTHALEIWEYPDKKAQPAP